MIIQLNLKGQVLTAIAPDLAEQSINKLFCSISADEEWDGLAIRLVFRSLNKLGIVARQAVVTDRTAVPVPPAVIRPGVLYINAIGVGDNGSVQLTTGDMDVGLKIKKVSALTAAAAEAITPTEYNELLSLIGDLSLIDIEDTGSVAAVFSLILANMGAVSKLDTVNKDNLVAAINEVLNKAALGCFTTAQQAALMREFSAKAVNILDADAVGVPVVNSMDDIDGPIGIARIIRSAEEESEQDAAGNVTIPSTGWVQTLVRGVATKKYVDSAVIAVFGGIENVEEVAF